MKPAQAPVPALALGLLGALTLTSGCQARSTSALGRDPAAALPGPIAGALTANGASTNGVATSTSSSWIIANAAAIESDRNLEYGTALSPGMIASLFGSGFSQGDVVTADLLSLDGQTDYGTLPVSIFAASADGSQLNLLIPDFDPTTVGEMRISVADLTGAPLGSVRSFTTAMCPAFFMSDATHNLPAGYVQYFDAAGNLLSQDLISPTTQIHWDASTAHVFLELFATGGLGHGCTAQTTPSLVMAGDTGAYYYFPHFTPPGNRAWLVEQEQWALSPLRPQYYGPEPGTTGVQQINIEITPYLNGSGWAAYDAAEDDSLSAAFAPNIGTPVPSIDTYAIPSYPPASPASLTSNPLTDLGSVLQLTVLALDCNQPDGGYVPFDGYINLPQVTSPLPMIECPQLSCPTLDPVGMSNNCQMDASGNPISGTCCTVQTVTDVVGCALCPVLDCVDADL